VDFMGQDRLLISVSLKSFFFNLVNNICDVRERVNGFKTRNVK